MTTSETLPTDARIRAAATELFYERGYHATTVRDIAGLVGIKAGSLYNHFPGKQDILFRICFDTAHLLLDGATARIAEADDDVEARLRAFVTWHVEFHAVNRFAARVADEQLNALTPENRELVVTVRDAHTQKLSALLDEGRAASRWAVGGSGVLTAGIAMMCTGVDVWYREDGPLTPKEIGATYADFVVNGLRTG
jgi:AcrR family transcriptional regulator